MAGEPPPGARPGEGEVVATGEDDRDIVNEHHHQGGPLPIRRHPRAERIIPKSRDFH